MSVARPRRALAAAIAAVAALSLAGCGDDQPESGAQSSPTVSSPSPSGSADASVPAIRLLDTGVAPRRMLEVDVEKGHVETSVMRMTTSTSADILSSPPITLPVEMRVTTRVTEVAGDRITVESTYGEVTIASGSGLDAASRAQILKSMRFLDGTKIRTIYDSSARSVSTEVEYGDVGGSQILDRLLDDIAAQSSNLTVLFPQEEVGVGARWRSDSTITIGGITSDVSTTFELTALSDDAYTVSVSSQQESRPGPVTGGEVIDGLTKVTGSSEGRSGFVLPVRGSSKGQGTVTMEVGGQRVRTTFDMSMRLTTR